MKAIEYKTMDKSNWGPGPWQDEPDKMQWMDEATGMPCLIVRNSMGNLCGYVGVAADHPWHGKDYNASVGPHTDTCDKDPELYHYGCTISGILDAHGGINFSRECHPNGDEKSSICHLPEPGEPDHMWWFGFDCGHCDDLSPGMADINKRLGISHYRHGIYRDVAYVKDQIASLAKQLKAVA